MIVRKSHNNNKIVYNKSRKDSRDVLLFEFKFIKKNTPRENLSEFNKTYESFEIPK